MRRLDIGQISVPYEIRWSPDRKSIGLSLSSSSELTVSAPSSAGLEEIEAMLEKKKPWLLRKLRSVGEQEAPPQPKEYLSGEKLPYNGRHYRIQAEAHPELEKPVIKFTDDRFRINTPVYDSEAERVESIRRALKDWYRRAAEKEFPASAQKYGSKMGLKEVDVAIYDSETKWGEAKNGGIRLNWRLILAPTRIQDYIIVHELAHLKRPESSSQHSRAFWHTVGSLLPDYEERKEWLRKNGNRLYLV
jgi:hypothetical protein